MYRCMVIKEELKRIIAILTFLCALLISGFVCYCVYSSTGNYNYGDSEFNLISNYWISVDLKSHNYSSYGDVNKRYVELITQANKIISNDNDLDSIDVSDYEEFSALCYKAENTLNNIVITVDEERDETAYCSDDIAVLVKNKYLSFYGVDLLSGEFILQKGNISESEGNSYVFKILTAYETGSLGIRNQYFSVNSSCLSVLFFGDKACKENPNSILPFNVYFEVQKWIFCCAFFWSLLFGLMIMLGNSGEITSKKVILLTSSGAILREKSHIVISIILATAATAVTFISLFFLSENIWLFKNEPLNSLELARMMPQIWIDVRYITFLVIQMFVLIMILILICTLFYSLSELISRKSIGVVVWIVSETIIYFGLRSVFCDVRACSIGNGRETMDYIANYTITHNSFFILFTVILIGGFIAFLFHKNHNRFLFRKVKVQSDAFSQ